MKILIVEDNEIMQRMYGRAMLDAGYVVVTSGDGQAALDLAAQEAPDIIMLDVMMPNMNGIQVLEALKANDATKAIPIIMLSANDDGNLMQKAMELGANHYLVKALLEPADVVKLVNDTLTEAN